MKQITWDTGRAYEVEVDGQTIYAPSITHILRNYWPRSVALENWIASKGIEEAERIRDEAGEEGSYVHEAAVGILEGRDVLAAEAVARFGDRRSEGVLDALEGFLNYCEDWQPSLVAAEYQVYNLHPLFAGTVDLSVIMRCPGKKGRQTVPVGDGRIRALIDIKTSNSVHDQHRAQAAAYHMAVQNMPNQDLLPDTVALLHLGNSTKRKYSLIDITDELPEWHVKALASISMFHAHNPTFSPPAPKSYREIYRYEQTPC